MRKFSGIIAVTGAVLLSLLLIASAYGGTISPMTSTIPSFLVMLFPVLAPAAMVLALIFVFIKRMVSLIIFIALAVSLPAILAYFPVKGADRSRQADLSVMSYNVANLFDFATGENRSKNNPTLRFILEKSPDIAVLQECATFYYTPTSAVSESQVDSLFATYPHHINGPEGQAILSKFPFEEIILHYPPRHDFQVRAYRFHLPADTFTLFNLHLKSIGLNQHDKAVYKELTKGKADRDDIKQELREIRSSLISKLSAAFRERADQAQKVRELIDSVGGKVIVCGDFNDVPLCYAIRTIESAGLKDAYRQAAFGPAITFHEDRFYFRIDHILYRGFHPVRVERIKTPHSDHYPVLSHFSTDN